MKNYTMVMMISFGVFLSGILLVVSIAILLMINVV